MKSILTGFYALLLIASYNNGFAQTEQENLKATILHNDSAFWKAYNTCDTSNLKQFFTDDVEFYHDKGGITLGASDMAESIARNLCNNANYRLRREAVIGTVRVFPLQKGKETYGAILTGDHVFYITQDGKPEFLDGAASFTHLWILQNGAWKMKRILSYNHHAATYTNERKEIILQDKQLDQLVGHYKSTQSGNMTIIRKDHLLVLKDEKNSYTLYPQSDTTFFVKDRDLVFDFIKDTKGNLLKIVVKEHGAKADELMFEK